MPVRNKLFELLSCPLRTGLRSQVIEDEQRCVANLLEQFIVRNVAVRIEGRTQMVEQVRCRNIESVVPLLDSVIGYRRRQVGLAATARAGQHQPPLRFLCENPGCLECFPVISDIARITPPAIGIQRIETYIRQPAEIAVAAQVGLPLRCRIVPGTTARHHPAVIRPSVRQQRVHELNPFAYRAQTFFRLAFFSA